MKEGKIKERIWVDFFNGIKFFLLGYFLVFTIDYSLFRERFSAVFCLLLSIPALVSFLVRERAARLYQFFLGGLGVVAVCFLLGRTTAEKILFVLFGLAALFVVWKGKIKENQSFYVENYGLAWMVVMIPAWCYAKIRGLDYVMTVMVYVCILFCWFHFLNKYKANQLRYFYENTRTAGEMAKGQVRNYGNWVIALFSALGAAVLVIGASISGGGIGEAISHGLFVFCRWLLHFLETDGVEEGIAETATPTPSVTPLYGTGQQQEQSHLLEQIMQMIEQVIWVIVKCLGVAAVVGLVAAVCYVVWKSFYGKVEVDTDKKDSTGQVQREKMHGIVQKKRTERFFFLRNPNQKMRQMFYKEVKEYAKDKQQSKKEKTATELSRMVVEEEQKIMDRILPFYQKARYSGQMLQKEELDRCKAYRKEERKKRKKE